MTAVALNFLGGLSVFIATFYASNIYTKIDYPSIRNILLSLVLYDSVYYWAHYAAHYTPVVYEVAHKIHHVNIIDLMPLDTLHNDILENMLHSTLLCLLPLLIIENLVEYIVFIVVLYAHSFYLHSEMKGNFILPFFNTSEYHNLHHKIGKGNFALFFTGWDDYMGTRLSKEYAKNSVSDSLPTITKEEFEAECKKGRKLTIINNSVVDCEKWINDHPGGKIVIESLAGKDSTDTFTKIHSKSIYANEMIKTLTIATLRE